jgi:adhesin HecA-like repeat protein
MRQVVRELAVRQGKSVPTLRSARRALPILSAAVVAVTAADALAGTYTYSPTFETNAQSLFGTGGALVSINKQNQFLGARWGQADQGGPVTAQVSAGNYTDGNGFLLRGETSGRIGMEYGLKIDSGSIDASLPYDVTIDVPEPNRLVVGQPFQVSTAANYRIDEASFVSRSPTFQFYSDFIFETKARLSGQASVDMFFFDKQVNFDKTLLDINARQELIAVNRDNDGQVRVLPFLFSAASTAKDAYDNASAASELKKEINSTTGRREKVKVALKKVGISFSGELPAEASIRLPYIEMDGSNIVRDGNKIRSSDKDGFAEFSFDLDRIASTVFPQIPPMTINAELDLVIGSIETSATLVDVDFNPTLNLTQTAEVAANKLGIDFDFGRTVTAGVLNADGSVAVARAPRSSLKLNAGQKLDVVYDGQDMNLTPTFSVDAALRSQFGLSISSEIAFKALMASLEAKLFGFEVGGFNIGPAFQTSVQFPDVSLGNLFDSTFALQGFNSVEGGVIFVSDKAAEYTGPALGQWTTAGNWKVGTNTTILPSIGRSAIIGDNKPVFAGTTSVAANVFHLNIGTNSTLYAVNLNVSGDVRSESKISVSSGGTLTFKEESLVEDSHVISSPDLDIRSGGTIVLENNDATAYRVAILRLDGTPVTMDNGVIRTYNAAALNLNGGSSITATSNSGLESAFAGMDIYKTGNVDSTIRATNGAKLYVGFGAMYTAQPGGVPATPEQLIANEGPAQNLLRLHADANSTIQLSGGDIGTLGSYTTNLPRVKGLVYGARFSTAGTGRIVNAAQLTLSGVINDGTFVADAAESLILGNVYTTIRTIGNQILVNNGTMTFTARAGGKESYVYAELGQIAGTGEMRLIGYDNFVKVTAMPGGTDPSLVNREKHTIRADYANIGMGTLAITNYGNIIVDRSIGQGRGDVTIDAKSNFTNAATGLVQAKSGTIFIDTAGTGYSVTNNGTFEALDGSAIRMSSNTSLTNMSLQLGTQYGALQTLLGGTYRTERGGQIVLRANTSAMDAFQNKANIELVANFATANNGLFVTTPVGTRPLKDYATIINAAEGTFSLAVNSTFIANKFINRGMLELSNSQMLGVVNEAGGVISGSGEVTLKSTFANFATNNGSIIAVEAEGLKQLLIKAESGVNVIENQGLLAAINSDLVFPAGSSLAQQTPGALSFGKYYVEGTTQDTRLLLPIQSGFIQSLNRADVVLVGQRATLQSITGSSSIRDVQQTLTSISTDAKLTLDNNTQTFVNRVAISPSAQVILANGAKLAGAGYDVSGKISGTGTIDAPVTVVAGGAVEAKGGLLKLTQIITNNGSLQATTPGAVLNPSGATINGGTVLVNNIGAGLYGTGTINSNNFANTGTVAAGQTSLVLRGTGTYTNSGLMTTRERGVLVLGAFGAPATTVNNTNGTISAIDTGGLDLETDGGGIGGYVRLYGATVNNGKVLISGANSQLDGYGNLTNVDLDVLNAKLWVSQATFGGQTLTIKPASGTTALFYGSDLKIEGGGILRLQDGSFSAQNSDIRTLGGYVDLAGSATLANGKIISSNGGAVRVVTTGTLSSVKNTGRIEVNAGAQGTLAGTIDNRAGTIENRGTLRLNDADLVGGTVQNVSGATITVLTRGQILGASLTNASGATINVPALAKLTVNQSTDGTTAASTFTNLGTISTSGQLDVLNTSFATSGAVEILVGGRLNATTLVQNAGTVRVNGTASVGTYTLNGGTLYGSGRITGKLVNVGGTIAPGNSPGTLYADGGFEAESDNFMQMEVYDSSTFDRLVCDSGDITLRGFIALDFTSTPLEALGGFLNQRVSFDLFDVGPGHSIINNGVGFEFLGYVTAEQVQFDSSTGAVSFLVTSIPEPTSLAAVSSLAVLSLRRRSRK